MGALGVADELPQFLRAMATVAAPFLRADSLSPTPIGAMAGRGSTSSLAAPNGEHGEVSS